jgi:phosphodiesterase/alkaline phosphatase D-like protein
MRKIRTILTAAGSMVAALALTAGLALAVPGTADAAAFSCPSGHVCFYTGDNGTGSRCLWSTADPDWRNGAIQCSWAADRNVRSVFNNGTSPSFTGVVYYKGASYQDRAGCTRQGQSGNLAGTYKLRSHQWTTGRCG